MKHQNANLIKREKKPKLTTLMHHWISSLPAALNVLHCVLLHVPEDVKSNVIKTDEQTNPMSFDFKFKNVTTVFTLYKDDIFWSWCKYWQLSFIRITESHFNFRAEVSLYLLAIISPPFNSLYLYRIKQPKNQFSNKLKCFCHAKSPRVLNFPSFQETSEQRNISITVIR